jgi:hypothetical protein
MTEICDDEMVCTVALQKLLHAIRAEEWALGDWMLGMVTSHMDQICRISKSNIKPSTSSWSEGSDQSRSLTNDCIHSVGFGSGRGTLLISARVACPYVIMATRTRN